VEKSQAGLTARKAGRMARYWLMKSEPSECLIDDALAAPKHTGPWAGVCNYEARDFMRDGMQVGDGVLFVSVWARHLELTGSARDHCVHDERGGDDLQDCDDATRALAARRRAGHLHQPAHGRVVHTARLCGLVDVSRCAATDAAAVPRSGCSTAWAAA